MENKEEGVRLSRKYKVFQLYALQSAAGCLSAIGVLNVSWVENVFSKLNLPTLHTWFMAIFIMVGTISIAASGGIGLFRLINAKRIIKLIEKEDAE